MTKPQKATFAAGCFWGVQAVFEDLPGVLSTEVGYTGGSLPNPTYQQVCTHTTGHAEAVNIIFDPNVISYEELLTKFWQCHNPTLLNRQGPDVGTQYRSAIFYHDDTQRAAAEKSKQQANAAYSDLIVTEITLASIFYPAEDYHQHYFKKNPGTGCQH